VPPTKLTLSESFFLKPTSKKPPFSLRPWSEAFGKKGKSKYNMNKIIFSAIIIACTALAVFGQSKPNSEISRQIASLRMEKNVTLDYDKGGNTSRLKAVTDNFPERDAQRSGIQAMNFAMGFFYPGDVLKAAPDPIMLTFWVLTKKPRFSDVHNLRVLFGEESLDLGDARYVSKPSENMEYLNFQISRANLSRIAQTRDVKLQIGKFDFNLTPEQRIVIAEILHVSEVGGAK
jgi:hypothetical protein